MDTNIRVKPTAINDCDEYTSHPWFVARNKAKNKQLIRWFKNCVNNLRHKCSVSLYIYKRISKIKGNDLKPLGQSLQIICHLHLLFIGNMFSNFYFDDLKIVTGVWDTTFHRPPDPPTVWWLQNTALSPSFISWGVSQNSTIHEIICTLCKILYEPTSSTDINNSEAQWWYMYREITKKDATYILAESFSM